MGRRMNCALAAIVGVGLSTVVQYTELWRDDGNAIVYL